MRKTSNRRRDAIGFQNNRERYGIGRAFEQMWDSRDMGAVRAIPLVSQFSKIICLVRYAD